jgi:hypothetical protein
VTITVDAVAAAAGARVCEVLETAVGVTANDPVGRSYTLRLADLFAEEHRHLMLRVKLPALTLATLPGVGADAAWTFGAITLEYKDAMNDNVVEMVTVGVVVARPDKADKKGARDPLVVSNLLRLEGTKALAEAKRLGRLGQHQQAQAVLTQALAVINAGADGQSCAMRIHFPSALSCGGNVTFIGLPSFLGVGKERRANDASSLCLVVVQSWGPPSWRRPTVSW